MSTTHLSVLITGSNQGLGFHAALQLSKRKDVHLIISGRDASRLKDALASITSAEGCQATVDSVLIDISNDESIHAGVKEVEKILNGAALDVLVVSRNGSKVLFALTVSINRTEQLWYIS